METAGRAAHPCISRRCGHSADDHLRTPELEGAGETVVFCAPCQRHEVRSASKVWGTRRARLRMRQALPLRVV